MNSPEEIKRFVKERFPALGVNKSLQIARLLYETGRRECRDYRDVLKSCSSENKGFKELKKELLKKRFPRACSLGKKINPHLPALESPAGREADKSHWLEPENIYYEKGLSSSQILSRTANRFPEARTRKIDSLKDFMDNRSYDINTYNRRRKSMFLIKENYDFIKKCPCTSGCVCCGYSILNAGFGCPYECVYCYLQEYSNMPGITLAANITDFAEKLSKLKGKRIGSGEFCDSLVFDDITAHSEVIVEAARKHPGLIFEFKTKSVNTDRLLNMKPASNVVVGWSVNPQHVIDRSEFFTPALNARLEAAAEICRAGWDTAFHFDPIINYPGWEKDYRDAVELIYDTVPPERIRWISLGTLRFPGGLKRTIEVRFPETDILNGELLCGFDKKVRYEEELRADIYRKMSGWIGLKKADTFVYLCMENPRVWKKSGLKPRWRWE